MKAKITAGGVALWAAASLMTLACDSGSTALQIGKEEAAKMALQELPNAYLVGENFEMDLDRPVYRFFLQNGEAARCVTVDVATGRVLEVMDASDELAEATAREENVPEPISLAHREAAEYAAQQTFPGAVRKWKAQRENGRLVFKFSLIGAHGEERRLTVDARSQEILSMTPVLPDQR